MFFLKFSFLAILTFWFLWMDWRHQHIPVLALVLLMGGGLWGNPEFISSFILGATAFICWQLGYCGSGDIYLLLACGLWVSLVLLPLFCILSGILVFVFGICRKRADQNKFPLAPPVFLALWAVILYGLRYIPS